MNCRASFVAAGFFVCAISGFSQTQPTALWKFAVSGDSRNCGDVVMPAIAAGVLKTGANFYWHLGDFRAIYKVDEDLSPPPELHLNLPQPTKDQYLMTAWADAKSRQLAQFGSGIEVFPGIGNHEVINPQTRQMWVAQFEHWLNSPRLAMQRESDKDIPGPRSYYHWVMNRIDFITLDNAKDTLDPQQIAWLKARLADDEKSKTITTIVAGMHAALPGNKGLNHSMCDSKEGVREGREVYEMLWNLQQSGKKVYVLASHSHFVMNDVYDTPYWGNKVLPGWIVGTAGAVRYRLPGGVAAGPETRTDVYGFLVATVMSDGTIQFEFQALSLDDLRRANAGKYPESLVGWCYDENKDMTIPRQGACTE